MTVWLTTKPSAMRANALPPRPFNPFVQLLPCKSATGIAGFYLIEAADLNEAVQLASQMPPARVGSIEVRPVRELTSTTGERRQL